MAIAVQPSLVIPDAELTERFSASGGPGGQHANKAATRVELTWDLENSESVTETQRETLLAHFGPTVRVVVDDERSQLRNREIAEARLAGRVRTALVPERPRRPTRPTRNSQRRRVNEKRQNAQTKRLRQRPKADD